MPFFYETITKEDIKRYRIDQMFRGFRDEGVRPGNRYTFAVDRSRNIYFMIVRNDERDTGQIEAVLSWKDKPIRVLLRRKQGLSDFSDRPVKIAWELLRKPMLDSVPQEEVIDTLREALAVYSRGMVFKHVPDAIVELDLYPGLV